MEGVDLHTHSNISDGTFTPKQLVDAAAEKGIHTLALTDHDTMDGLALAVVGCKVACDAYYFGGRNFESVVETLNPEKLWCACGCIEYARLRATAKMP